MAGLKRLPDTTVADLPRMADFAHFSVAAEVGLGFEPGTFMAAYTANMENVDGLALEATPIAQYLIDEFEGQDWEGTATELLNLVNARATDKDRQLRTWPTSARGMRAAVDRLAPYLRRAGVDIHSFRETGSRRNRVIRISGQTTSLPDVSSDGPDGSDGSDGSAHTQEIGGQALPGELGKAPAGTPPDILPCSQPSGAPPASTIREVEL